MKSNGKRGAGKRLNDSQRLEIISKLQRPNPPSKRAIAREYDIVESSVRKLWDQRESIIIMIFSSLTMLQDTLAHHSR